MTRPGTAAPTARAAHWRGLLPVGAALALATAAVYAGTAGHGFVNYDDPGYVTGNPIVRAGLTRAGIEWAFTTGLMGRWHPVTWLSHMLDCQLFGVEPGPHHLVNVALHLTNVLLLLALLVRLTHRPWPSAFAAALFALHPLQVEPVAWIAGRKDVLGALFWLLTTGLYCRYVEAPRVGRYLPVLATLALGLLSSPVLVALPLVLLLLDYWPLARSRTEAGHLAVPPVSVVEKIPLLVLVGVSSVLGFLAQHHGDALADAGLPPGNRPVASTVIAYLGHLQKTLWPHDLGIPYPQHVPAPAWQVAGAAAFLVAVTVLALASARTRPYLVVGWLWYVATLLPAIGLSQAGEQPMADHYTYLPSIGIFIVAAWGGADLAARGRAARLVVAATAALVLAVCLPTTRAQVGRWRDSITLLEHTLAVTTDNEQAHFGLGLALAEQGRTPDAVPHFREAVRIDPDYAAAYTQLGLALAQEGNAGEAIAQYTAALHIDPTRADAQEFLGMSLAEQGNYTDAVAHLTAALRVRPGVARTHYTLGLALAFQGKIDEATAHFQETLRLDPGFAMAYYQLGQLWTAQGRTKEAVKAYRDALRLDPDAPGVLNELAWTLATDDSPDVRDGAGAVRFAEDACARSGRRDPTLLDTLAAAYAAAGRFEEAVATAETAAGLARTGGDDPLATEIAAHLELYRSGRPQYETPNAVAEGSR